MNDFTGDAISAQGDGVVIIGALGQIGRALTEYAILTHRSVLLVDVNQEGLRDLMSSLNHRAPTAVKILCVKSDAEDPGLEVVSFLRGVGDQPRHLINAAYPGKGFLSGSENEEIRRRDRTNFIGHHANFFLSITAHFSSYLAALGGGSITNLSSMYGSVCPHFDIYEGTGMSLPAEYGAAKAAVESLSRHFAAYYRASKVRVNCVAPGGIALSQPEAFVDQYGARTMSGGLLDPEDVLGVIKLLCSSAGQAITGQTILIDDGFSLS